MAFKVENCCFEHVAAQFLPGFRFGEHRMPERPGQVAAFFRITNLKINSMLFPLYH